MACLCDKFGDVFGCGDGWTICGGFCTQTPSTLNKEQKEDRDILVQIIDHLQTKLNAVTENLDNTCEICNEKCKHRAS